MNRQRYERICELFEAVLPLDPAERSALLTAECADDSSLVADVLDMLAHHQAAEEENFPPEPCEIATETYWPENEATPSRIRSGQVVAKRYRIVGLLGSGGMGDIHLADDLELGERVALKFLREELAADPHFVSMLRKEVRLSRKVVHRNVCRVHDLVGHDGQYFLTMEYVAGGSLENLLRLAKRPAETRAFAIARQICQGLNAIHEEGLIHRDLKPGNILLDPKGNVHISDFGIAVPSSATWRVDPAGTVQYMAPEQRCGQPCFESDIHSLGVVLCELYTGSRDSDSLTDINNPDIEKIIRLCLQPSPKKRPSKALAVSAELALASGVTLTPGETRDFKRDDPGKLRPFLARGLAACVIVGLILAAWLSGKTTLVGMTKVKDVDVLQDKAEELREPLNIGKPRDTACGVDYNREALYAVEAGEFTWSELESAGLTPVLIWYRYSSTTELIPQSIESISSREGLKVSRDDPPEGPGMARLILNPSQGRIVEFRKFPSVSSSSTSSPPPTAAWWRNKLVEILPHTVVELPLGASRDVPPKWVPFRADYSAVWMVPIPDTEKFVRVEVACVGDELVFFRVGPDSEGQISRESAGVFAAASSGKSVASFIGIGLFVALLVIGTIIGLYNLHLRKVDRRGAFRLAAFVFSVQMLVWLCQASHVASISEVRLLSMGLAWALFVSAQIWIVHIALEPYVRQFWPRTLVSWNRLVHGRFSDALVGRHILIGCLCGVAIMLNDQMATLCGTWLSIPTGHVLDMGLWGRLDAMLRIGARIKPESSLAWLWHDSIVPLG